MTFNKINLMLIGAIFYCSLLQSQDKPNILLINIDDMGWRDVGFMGSKYYETPNIDKLAAKGMVFPNGYASAANCAPSRANLFSGKYPQFHGVYTVGSSERGKSKHRKLVPVENKSTISNDFKLLPQILKNNGYSTCHAGKWHISQDPLQKGFEVNIGGSHFGHPASYYPPYSNIDIDGDGYLTDVIMKKSIDFIKKAEEPFFLNYSPYAVHTPIQPIDSLSWKYKNKTNWKGQNNPGYATMIENLDRNIGKLIHTLKEMSIFENTFIVFTSDNGGLYGITQQKPLRAGKGSYYEGGIKVPFFFIWDDKIASESKNEFPISNIDLYPTILSVAGINQCKKLQLDGLDLSGLLTNQSTISERDLFWHFPVYLERFSSNNENRDSLFRTRPGTIIQSGFWKLHYYYEDKDVELYNLKEDISESTNLVTIYPKRLEKLLAKMKKWLLETNAEIPYKLNPEFETN